MDRDVLMHQMEERSRDKFAKALDAMEHAVSAVHLGLFTTSTRPPGTYML